MNNYRKILRIFLIVAAVCVCAAAIAFIVSKTKSRDEFRFPKNAMIQGVRVGGMNYSQAQSALDKKADLSPESFSLRVSAGEREFTLTQADFKYLLDYQSALDNLRAYSENHPLSQGASASIPYRVEPESVRAAVRKLARKIDKKPRNAKVKSFRPFSKKRFVIQNEKSGISLDRQSLCNMLTEFVNSKQPSGKITAIVDNIKPSRNSTKLRKSLKKLASAASYSYNTESGTINMRLALEACNGSVIEPDEVWSFNKHTGNSNSTANGYRKAEVILRKKLTQGVGGGICQASTTVFRAAVLANLGVEERHNHHWASGYTMSGEDATIDYPSLDLKLKNKSNTPVFIECGLRGRKLVVNIYGVKSRKYDNVKMYSENYDINYGRYYKTATYRVLYKKKKPLKKERVCTSYYSLAEYHAVRPADDGTFAR